MLWILLVLLTSWASSPGPSLLSSLWSGQQVFPGYLLCVRHCSGPSRTMSENSEKQPICTQVSGQWPKFNSLWYSRSLKRSLFFPHRDSILDSFYVSQFHARKWQYRLPVFAHSTCVRLHSPFKHCTFSCQNHYQISLSRSKNEIRLDFICTSIKSMTLKTYKSGINLKLWNKGFCLKKRGFKEKQRGFKEKQSVLTNWIK